MSEYNLGHTDGYYIGVTEGERQERAAIVAWLRGPNGPAELPSFFVNEIERGEHLGASDE